VCGALLNRSVENDDVLGALSVPALATHGDTDSSVLLAMAEHHAGLISDAALSVYPGVGHAPFYEDPARFNRELAAFVRRCQS
jgi:pimeloyl-ACP methyl ester carboxylesterase